MKSTILTTAQIDCHRRIGRNVEPARVAWVEVDALLDSHEELRAEVERLRERVRIEHNSFVRQYDKREELEATAVRLKAEVERLHDALLWCSGSADFGHNGHAKAGWDKLCAPLLRRTP